MNSLEDCIEVEVDSVSDEEHAFAFITRCSGGLAVGSDGGVRIGGESKRAMLLSTRCPFIL